MDLRDYPRPKNDTGIGVHWSPGFPAPMGLGHVRDVWLPELLALGVKWLKITRADGGTAFDELLLKHDIMPIVRVYRPQPNPGTLDQDMLRLVREHVAAGVRYFEFNNEPDLGVEWQNGFVPPDALTVAARNAIVDMEAILACGGYPGIPAVTVGSKWDLMGEICRLGRRDLFREPVWQAVHNYAINHPLDYPYDPGNQAGAGYTEQFYNQMAGEPWGGDAWGSWSLERINQERATRSNPGATAYDDPSCWLAYERYDRLIRYQIGRSLPILGTEDGYIVGERPDPRYPATTPALHMAQSLEACRIMMGTSRRFKRAPDYFFCTAFWLLGNYSLGNWASEWEGAAWYSGRWPEGQLPAVMALKAEPKSERVWYGDGGGAGQVSGSIRGGAELKLALTRDDGWAAQVTAGADEQFLVLDVPHGNYTLTVLQATQYTQQVTVSAEAPDAVAGFDLTGVVIAYRDSVLSGKVQGGAGAVLRLVRQPGGWRAEAVAADDGTYRFANLGPGLYRVHIAGVAGTLQEVQLDGRQSVVLDLVKPGWGWESTLEETWPGFGILRCRVQDYPAKKVRIWADGWSGFTRETGDKPEYGLDACEFAPLGAGTYYLQPEGVDVKATVRVDGSRVVWATFIDAAAKPLEESVVRGVIRGGAGRRISLKWPAGELVTQADPEGTFGFGGLAAGSYRLEVMGSDLHQDITLDGRNQVEVNLELVGPPVLWRWHVQDGGPGHGFSLIRCRVTGKPGTQVRLWTDGWDGVTGLAGSKTEYGADALEFAPLAPGTYYLEGVGLQPVPGRRRTLRATVELPPNRITWLYFEPLPPVPESEAPVARGGRSKKRRKVSPAGAEPAAAEAVALPKLNDHYLLVGKIAETREDFLAVMQFVRDFSPLVGNDLAQARQARHVTILGDYDVIGLDVEDDLRQNGCQVLRVRAWYSEALGSSAAVG